MVETSAMQASPVRTPAEPDSSRERFLVLKGSGGAGLGDKVRALLSAVTYAHLTHRTLYVEWNDSAYGDGTLNYFDSLLTVKSVRTTAQRPLSGRVRPAIWQDRLHLSFDNLYAETGPSPWDRSWAVNNLSFDQGILDWPEEICVMWDFDQFSKMAPALPQWIPSVTGAEPLERQLGEVLRTQIGLSPEVACTVSAALQSLNVKRPFLGIHVRAADESFQARSAPPVSAYVRAAKKMMCQLGIKTVFLATDNRRVQELFRAEFGEKNVIWTEKWLPEPGVALHLENNCPDRLQAAKDALTDVFLLAAADALITMNNSSFGILARMISAVPEKNRLTLMWHPPLWKRVFCKLGWNRDLIS